jgi:hypothetical protein
MLVDVYGMRDMRNVYKILDGKPDVRRLFVTPSRERRIQWKWILGKQDLWVWTGFVRPETDTDGGLL